MRKRESSGALIGLLVGGVALLTLGVVAFRSLERPAPEEQFIPCPLHTLGPTPVQQRVDLPPPALWRQDWLPPQAEVGPAEPRSGWRRFVETGTTLAGPVNPTVPRPPRFYGPVPCDLFNREIVFAAVDLRVPSRGFDFILARAYGSRANFNQVAGGLAYNWDYTYNRHLVIQGNGDAAVCDGLGREDVFTGPAPNYTAPTGIFDKLVKNGDNTFTQTNAAGMRFNYSTAGWLTSMVDRASNVLFVNRDGSNKITTIRDTQDREYTFAYDGAGRLNSVTDFAGRTVVYTRDANLDLIKVRSPIVSGTPNGQDFPSGKTTLMTYSSGLSDSRRNHNLLKVIEPLYNVNDDPAQSKAWLTIVYHTASNPSNLDFDRVSTVQVGHADGGPPGVPGIVVGGTYTLTRLTTPGS